MSIEYGGLARKAVYICTEGEPPTTRLSQMSDAHVSMFPDAFQRGNPLEHVLIEKVCGGSGSPGLSNALDQCSK